MALTEERVGKVLFKPLTERPQLFVLVDSVDDDLRQESLRIG